MPASRPPPTTWHRSGGHPCRLLMISSAQNPQTPVSRPGRSQRDRHFYFGKLLCRIFGREQLAIASLSLNFFEEPEAALTTQLNSLSCRPDCNSRNFQSSEFGGQRFSGGLQIRCATDVSSGRVPSMKLLRGRACGEITQARPCTNGVCAFRINRFLNRTADYENILSMQGMLAIAMRGTNTCSARMRRVHRGCIACARAAFRGVRAC
jgi:hypothetical protein